MAIVTLPTTLTNGSLADATLVMGDFNAILAQVNGHLDGTNLDPALLALIGASDPANVRTGFSIIATTEARTNAAYGLMTTPDRVSNVVLPTGGLIEVYYQATWQETITQQSRAAIFVGANQLKVAIVNGAPAIEEAYFGTGAGVNIDTPLSSFQLGLQGGNASGAPSSDVTTGEVIGQLNGAYFVGAAAQVSTAVGGPAVFFANAGTYDISVQFKAASGTVTVKNRRLYVKAIGF